MGNMLSPNINVEVKVNVYRLLGDSASHHVVEGVTGSGL
jgi:hypothetical protein